MSATGANVFATDARPSATVAKASATDVEAFAKDVEMFATDVIMSAKDAKTISSVVDGFVTDVRMIATEEIRPADVAGSRFFDAGICLHCVACARNTGRKGKFVVKFTLGKQMALVRFVILIITLRIVLLLVAKSFGCRIGEMHLLK